MEYGLSIVGFTSILECADPVQLGSRQKLCQSDTNYGSMINNCADIFCGQTPYTPTNHAFYKL